MATTKIADFNFSNLDAATIFILDTNILYFVHSGYYTNNDPKSSAYSNLISTIIQNGFSIQLTSLTLQEFLFGIETKEFNLYRNQLTTGKSTYGKKDFRRDHVLRGALKHRLEVVLKELYSVYELKDMAIDCNHIDTFVDSFDMHRYDPIDYVLVNNFIEQNVIYVTDDTDFHCDASIDVLTI